MWASRFHTFSPMYIKSIFFLIEVYVGIAILHFFANVHHSRLFPSSSVCVIFTLFRQSASFQSFPPSIIFYTLSSAVPASWLRLPWLLPWRLGGSMTICGAPSSSFFSSSFFLSSEIRFSSSSSLMRNRTGIFSEPFLSSVGGLLDDPLPRSRLLRLCLKRKIQLSFNTV